MQAVDVERIQQSAQRYEDRAARRGGPARVARGHEDPRKEHLARRLAQERAFAAVAEAEAHGVPRTQRQTLASLARERIIGSSDLLDLNYLEFAIAVSRAVCRLRVGDAVASGCLVGPRIVMTNNHVIASAAEARQAEAQFDYQQNMSGELLPVHVFRFDPDYFFLTDPRLDFTLVGTAAASTKGRTIDRYPWLRLIGTLGKAEEGDPVNIIQHPRGGLKQIALRNNLITVIPDGLPDFLYYTTDTEPGSSGSPCFNDQWEVVALHHQGVPRRRGGQILRKDGTPWREGADDPALIDWIANEGARVSAIVAALESADLRSAEAEVRARILRETPPNPVEIARRADPSGNGAGPALDGNGTAVAAANGAAVSFSLPLTITVALGAPPAARAVAGAIADAVVDAIPAGGDARSLLGDVAEKVVIDPDWSNREGYDAAFLGIDIPLPVLSAEMKKQSVEVPPEYRRNGNKYALPYHKFSVVMNKKRRFAWFSAANVDGDQRPKLPERKGDEWFIDPRIDDPDAPRFQLGEELYAAAKTDRGHLTRYLDVAWGVTKADAIRSLSDTFHFTNCCLQLEGFNRGKSRWQGIEQFLLEQKAKKERRRLVAITGPIFRAHDPLYQNQFMDAAVRIPLSFWKVCALIRDDDTLSATAFILGQEDITGLPGFEEALDVAAVQVTLAELEQRTGLSFGLLREHDHLAAGGDPGTLEVDRRVVRPLRSLEDIVV